MNLDQQTIALPRTPTLPRDLAMRVAATEYDWYADVLRALRPEDWARPTECPGWDVRDMASHVLGMAEMAGSIWQNVHQIRAARRRGGVMIDALTAVQVEERSQLIPAEIEARFAKVGPRPPVDVAELRDSFAAKGCQASSR